MRLEEIFESIEKAPVASGSIGQIHRAMLSKKGAKVTGCTPGQVVAVKVGPGESDEVQRESDEVQRESDEVQRPCTLSFVCIINCSTLFFPYCSTLFLPYLTVLISTVCPLAVVRSATLVPPTPSSTTLRPCSGLRTVLATSLPSVP